MGPIPSVVSISRSDRIDVRKADVKRTPQGGIEVPVYVTRIGVFDYGDGVLELRHPEDVFDPASLATLHGAPIVLGHPDVITADNWRQHTVGHLADDAHVEEERYVASRARIQDGEIANAALDKILREFSCGYTCDHEEVSGEYQGEKYTRRQRNIRYNHVGIGGTDWGRAGPEVRVRVDGTPYPQGEMPDPVPNPDTVSKAEYDRLAGELAAANARISALEAANTPEKIDAKVKARVELLDSARTVLGADAKFDGKSDADVRREAVAKAFPEIKLDGKSEDFVAGLFASALAKPSGAVNDAADAVRVDAPSQGKDERAEMIARNRNAGRAPLKKVS